MRQIPIRPTGERTDENADGAVKTDDLDGIQVISTRALKTADQVADKDGVKPQDNADTDVKPHEFVGDDPQKCSKCGLAKMAKAHVDAQGGNAARGEGGLVERSIVLIGTDGDEVVIPLSMASREFLAELEQRMKTADQVADKDHPTQPADTSPMAVHKFQGGDLKKCKKCGTGINAMVHKPSWPSSHRAAELDDLRTIRAAEEAELETRAMAVDPAKNLKPGPSDLPAGSMVKHRFEGGDIAHCAMADCNKPVTDPIHRRM